MDRTLTSAANPSTHVPALTAHLVDELFVQLFEVIGRVQNEGYSAIK